MRDKKRWWWPDPSKYWPDGAKYSSEIDDFIDALEKVGFARTVDITPDPKIHRIALYAKGGKVQHAARQLPDGRWTSKLGANIDIAHTLPGLEGTEYGTVIGYMEKPIS